MGEVAPKFNLDYDVVSKGLHLFECKETGIEPPKEGKKSGRRFWARMVVVGGEDDGVAHMESFFSITKEDFSFAKMFGFLVKLGIIPADIKKLNTDTFNSPAFEERWLRTLRGARMGAKIGWKYRPEDKELESPQSEMKTYYSLNEYMDLIKRQETAKDQKGPVTAKEVENIFATPATGQTTIAPPPPATPKEKPPWE